MKRGIIKKLCAALLAALLGLMPLPPAAAASGETYPACEKGCVSIVDALKALGEDSSFAYRGRIAASNGISGYSGTARENMTLLELLKAGKLLRPGDTPLEENLSRVKYIAQGRKTCKATALAMAVNLLRGTDACTTREMGGSCCCSIQGLTYTGSDGHSYTGVYRTDRYVGSYAEEAEAIETALAAGVPVLAAVHSTAGGTRHHWVLVVGKSGEDYLIADPAYGTSGAISENLSTLSARHYALGLTDYACTHYGYVTFTP